MRFRQSILPAAAPLAMSVRPFSNAEAKTVEAGDATASWNGKGVIDDLGFGERVFTGRMTGTMPIRHPELTPHALIHAAKVGCQAVIRFSENREEAQTALCIMTAHEGKDVAHAKMRWKGKKDECRGEFIFIWEVEDLRVLRRPRRSWAVLILSKRKRDRSTVTPHGRI